MRPREYFTLLFLSTLHSHSQKKNTVSNYLHRTTDSNSPIMNGEWGNNPNAIICVWVWWWHEHSLRAFAKLENPNPVWGCIIIISVQCRRTLEACRRSTPPFKTGNEVKEKGMIIPAWGPHGLHIQHIGRKRKEGKKEGRNFWHEDNFSCLLIWIISFDQTNLRDEISKCIRNTEHNMQSSGRQSFNKFVHSFFSHD